MSQDTIKKHKNSLEKDYAILPRDLAKDKRLSPFARLVLIYLLCNSDEWIVRMEFAAFEMGVNVKTFRGAIRELYNLGFIKREQQRKSNGYFDYFDYEVSHNPIFENPNWSEPKPRISQKKDGKAPQAELSVQASQPSAQIPPTVKPPAVNSPLPIPKKPIPKTPMVMVALPDCKKKQEDLAASPGKKVFPKSKARVKPRTPEHEDRFQFLIGLKIGSDSTGYIDENTASFLSSKFTYTQIESAYYTLQTKLRKRERVDSPAAMFVHLLKNEHNPTTAQSEINETFAREFAAGANWSSLVIKGKFVYDKNNSAKDLNLNMPFEAFQSSLYGLHSSCCNG